jgi:hypothetical protein
VPAVTERGVVPENEVRAPCHDVRLAGWDQLVAAGTAVGLSGRFASTAAHRPDQPLAVRTGLPPGSAAESALDVEWRGLLPWRTPPTSAGAVAAGHVPIVTSEMREAVSPAVPTPALQR